MSRPYGLTLGPNLNQNFLLPAKTGWTYSRQRQSIGRSAAIDRPIGIAAFVALSLFIFMNCHWLCHYSLCSVLSDWLRRSVVSMWQQINYVDVTWLLFHLEQHTSASSVCGPCHYRFRATPIIMLLSVRGVIINILQFRHFLIEELSEFQKWWERICITNRLMICGA